MIKFFHLEILNKWESFIMALKFRKRIKVAPGIHLNISKKGVSTTIGPKGLSVNASKKGVYLNTSIPKTGISSRTKLMDGERKIKSVQERHIHQEPAQSSWTERLLWFISLSWLGVCYLMFTDVSGWRKLVILTVAILPFAVYWYWESRKNRAYHEDDE